MYAQAPTTLPTSTLISANAEPLVIIASLKTPIAAKPHRTAVTATNGTSPARIAVLGPGPSLGRIAA